MVYVANFLSNNVSGINTATYGLVTTVGVGSLPESLGNFVWGNITACTGTASTFTITVNSGNSATLATANTNQTLTIGGGTVFSSNCTNLIATVLPNGASPVSGSTVAKVWIEPTQPVQYVKRHYEINPAANATTATANVTLYFTQAEFDDFNAINAVKLPTGAADAAGISNLLIEKRSGVSSDGTGLPNTYTGSVITINPADASIIWNTTYSRWEVSFDITGFSGFFVKTQTGALPVQWLSITGSLNTQKQASIKW